jgi:hypothetical protein
VSCTLHILEHPGQQPLVPMLTVQHPCGSWSAGGMASYHARRLTVTKNTIHRNGSDVGS